MNSNGMNSDGMDATCITKTLLATGIWPALTQQNTDVIVAARGIKQVHQYSFGDVTRKTKALRK
ncbi:MAG: hypothetical protein U1F46_14165 [Marinagarivorans sp.]